MAPFIFPVVLHSDPSPYGYASRLAAQFRDPYPKTTMNCSRRKKPMMVVPQVGMTLFRNRQGVLSSARKRLAEAQTPGGGEASCHLLDSTLMQFNVKESQVYKNAEALYALFTSSVYSCRERLLTACLSVCVDSRFGMFKYTFQHHMRIGHLIYPHSSTSDRCMAASAFNMAGFKSLV